jgi:5-methylcytosine-specific restriction endonuclease McrA
MSGELSTARWQRFRLHILRTHPPICAACGRWIDKTLPGTHPQGPSVDHIHPRNKGGRIYDLNNVTLMHMGCNAGKKDDTPRPTTRPW